MVKQNAKALGLLIIFVLCITLVSSLEPITQNQTAEIKHSVRLGGGVAPVGTSCNITILYPNKSILINFQPMTRLVDQYQYNLTGTQTSTSGVYDYDVTCVHGGLNDTLSSSLIINPGGIEPSQQRTDTLSRTIWFFFALALLCFISIFMVRKPPIKITMFLFMFWFILMGVNTSLLAMQDEVINPQVEEFFEFMLVLSFIANRFILIAIAGLWCVIFFITFKDRMKTKTNERYDYGSG